jgi:uncharacterized lipoprotein YajG
MVRVLEKTFRSDMRRLLMMFSFLAVVALLVSGCSKPERDVAATPPVTPQQAQQKIENSSLPPEARAAAAAEAEKAAARERARAAQQTAPATR